MGNFYKNKVSFGRKMRKLWDWLKSPIEVSMWWYVIVMIYFSLQLLDWGIGKVLEIVQ